MRICNPLVKDINDKNPPDERLNNPDLPAYFTPLYTDFFLRKRYRKELHKFLNGVNEDMASAGKNVITYGDHYPRNDYYPRNNKLFRHNDISVFNPDCPDPKDNGVVTGKDQKMVYVDIGRWLEHLQSLILAKPYREAAIIKSIHLGF